MREGPENMRESIEHTARLSMIAIAAFSIFACVFSPVAHAVPASPHLFEETQPDGAVVKLHVRGDERFHWMEDEAGYTVVRSNKREYMYGQRNAQGRVVPTNLRVGRDDPKQAGLGRHIQPSDIIRKQVQVTAPQSPSGGSTAPELGSPVTGTVKNLVVLVRFSDHTTRPLPSRANVDTLFNALGGDPTLAPTGSVKDYYAENSYGNLTLESTVLDWVTVPQTEAYYANGVSGDSTLWGALRYALDAADTSINFNDYDTDGDGVIDAIAFIHSGYGAEWGGTDAYGATSADRIWSHKWTIQPAWTSSESVTVSNYHISPGVWGTSGSAIGRIGVICHETGHFLGLPDLYDTDTSVGNGIGSWGLMANSWGFDGSQYYPPHMSSWSKIELGWLTPTVISTSGTYALQQFETNAEVYRIDLNFPTDEYLLIENRQPTGFEADIPQGGLCVFHIDDLSDYNTQGYPGQSGWPENGYHYRVAVLQADGAYHLEKGNNRGDAGDVYHSTGVNLLDSDTVPNTDTYQSGVILPTGNTLFNISASASTMSFDYSTEVLNILPDIAASDSSLSFAMPAGATDSRTLVLSNDADAGGLNLDYLIQASVEGQVEDTVGSAASGWTGAPRYRGNFYHATSSTTLTKMESFLNISGSATLHFVVYETSGITATDVKTLIFGVTGTVGGVGTAFYGAGPISVPLQAGKYYGIAVGWNTESISYYADAAAQPTVSFGSKMGYFSYNTYPMPSAFTGDIGIGGDNYYQRLTAGAASWASVTPSSGSLAPQASQNITVTANAAGFTPGNYEALLTVTSNDPDESPLFLPVGLVVGLQSQVYVNFGFTGPEFGTSANPYNTLAESLDAVQANGTVTIVGGGASPEILDINQAVTIEAVTLEATIGEIVSVPVAPPEETSPIAATPERKLSINRVPPANQPAANRAASAGAPVVLSPAVEETPSGR
jgi:M6 family metalloprotease-like protein